jgi:DMSO/TMAO reductase YedYZ molybdopterin-dependent catalytic subunit
VFGSQEGRDVLSALRALDEPSDQVAVEAGLGDAVSATQKALTVGITCESQCAASMGLHDSAQHRGQGAAPGGGEDEGGAQRVDVARWRLRVSGAVRTPLSLDVAALSALPAEEHEYPLNCVTGWSATRRWRGVPVAALLDMAGADPRFGHVQVRSTSGYHWDHDRGHVLLRGALLVTHVDGVRLDDDHGFPARLLIPGLQGQSNVKWVDELTVGLGRPQLYVGPNLEPRSQPVTGSLLPPDPAGSRQ